MKLTATKVRQSKPKEKDYKLYDGGGLFLLVKKNGSKYWRLKYRYKGKEKMLALGVYPKVSLQTARNEASKAKRSLQDKLDPSKQRKQEKAARLQEADNSFAAIAREWVSINATWSESHKHRVIRSLEVDVFDHIGDDPITDISAPELLAVIRRVESRDALDVASRILQRSGAVFRYAIQTGRATMNPATELKGVLRTRKTTHVASIPPSELPGLIKAIKGYEGHPITRNALRLLLLTFVRSRELRGAKWEEFNLDTKEWRIPAERMKMGTEHIVPLSRQALEVIEEMKPLSGNADLMFHGERTTQKQMSGNTLLYAMYRMGYKSRATPHGVRATASSVLNEQGYTPDAIERQLSHTDRDSVRSAYTHHARYLDERRKMMQWWADYLDSLNSNVVPIRAAKR